MRLSMKSEYAFLALIHLANRYSEGTLVRVEEIAESGDIPQKFLEQILLMLKRHGFLKSRRGIGGGYSLARPPDKIPLADVIRLMDGPIAPVNSVSEFYYEHTPIEKAPKLKALMRELRDYLSERLEKATIADLI